MENKAIKITNSTINKAVHKNDFIVARKRLFLFEKRLKILEVK